MERSAGYFEEENGIVRISDRFVIPKEEHYNYDFYDLCYSLGYAYKQQMGENVPNMASLDSEGQMKLYQELYGLGRQIVGMQKAQ